MNIQNIFVQRAPYTVMVSLRDPNAGNWTPNTSSPLWLRFVLSQLVYLMLLKFFKHCIYVNLHCLFSSLFKFEGHRFIGSQLFSVTVWNYVLLFGIIIIIIIIIIISLLYSAFPLFSFECFASLCRYYLNVVYWLNGRERLFPILHSLLILFLERTKT